MSNCGSCSKSRRVYKDRKCVHCYIRFWEGRLKKARAAVRGYIRTGNAVQHPHIMVQGLSDIRLLEGRVEAGKHYRDKIMGSDYE